MNFTTKKRKKYRTNWMKLYLLFQTSEFFYIIDSNKKIIIENYHK